MHNQETYHLSANTRIQAHSKHLGLQEGTNGCNREWWRDGYKYQYGHRSGMLPLKSHSIRWQELSSSLSRQLRCPRTHSHRFPSARRKAVQLLHTVFGLSRWIITRGIFNLSRIIRMIWDTICGIWCLLLGINAWWYLGNNKYILFMALHTKHGCM